MEDLQIISLYFKRDEAAISETATKYGAFCHRIALNILSTSSDADECVNDTYLRAWNSIPPQKPDKLGAWLASLPQNDRILFMCRYWNGETVNTLAQESGMSPANMAKKMYRLRQNLKSKLEKEGYSL